MQNSAKKAAIITKRENITKASEKLNISQPAVTKQIKNLENQLSLVINEYCLKYPEVNLNLICEETSKMLEKLENKEIDIVFSKKIDIPVSKNIKYIKLGYLNDVLIASKNSEIANKKLTIENIENQIIYVPRVYAQAVERLKKLTDGKNLKLKNSSYKTILELASSGKAIGLITREYIDEDDYEKFGLVEVKTDLKLGKIEFGIYLNSERSKELRNLVDMIEECFK